MKLFNSTIPWSFKRRVVAFTRESDHLPRITGLPSQVNAAIALLAYDPQSPLWVRRCPPSAWLKQSWRHTLGIWLWSWRRGSESVLMARLFLFNRPSVGQMQGRSRDMILPSFDWWHWQLGRSFLMARLPSRLSLGTGGVLFTRKRHPWCVVGRRGGRWNN